ncbi:(2Fe-2S)-binding protein [Tianweitania sp.]|uniref:(2Fe-2S)-binding protein n=1 Tax=Tianweitania sp. TaxID=2021634 RepID=UPI00289D41EF|nr:(2Fe-2S)-binding protein [Tianweitania sp.]
MRLIDGVQPPAESVSFTFEGKHLTAWPGEAIASAIMRAGIQTMRKTRIQGNDRGYFCGMGLCWECAVHVEGQGVIRSCSHPVVDGQIISFADGPFE